MILARRSVRRRHFRSTPRNAPDADARLAPSRPGLYFNRAGRARDGAVRSGGGPASPHRRPSQVDRLRWKRPVIFALKAVITVLVILAVGRYVMRTWGDLSRH